ncbi:MAG: helix-turn-helix domain-containing protein [Bifidobacterium crudilactis]|uniref:Helix-turn-helix domain-containing protein n=1 Tax=Bifidobacterium crudilactis TaxID=327277 RepID=A0A971CZN0_9BIFI|nr:helix-turn-helix domain-containing protein [Bifidobacterium crudilactis]NLT79752.1 helix-turn-helix domain-containing protein [Bifidobacterium crudilactis]
MTMKSGSSIRFNIFQKRTSIGLNMFMALPVRIDIPKDKNNGFSVKILADYSSDKQRIVATSVSVISDGMEEVTGTVMRSLRLREYVRDGVKRVVELMEDDGSLVFSGDSIEDMAREHIDERPADREEKLLWIARVYRFSEVTNGSPTQDVAELLGISTRAATRWIAECRETGLLNKA